MAVLIPKETKYRIRFRNKIKSHKFRNYDLKQTVPTRLNNLYNLKNYEVLNKRSGFYKFYSNLKKNII